jgi:hypothetical protein
MAVRFWTAPLAILYKRKGRTFPRHKRALRVVELMLIHPDVVFCTYKQVSDGKRCFTRRERAYRKPRYMWVRRCDRRSLDLAELVYHEVGSFMPLDPPSSSCINEAGETDDEASLGQKRVLRGFVVHDSSALGRLLD